MTGPAVDRWKRTALVRTFTMSFVLAEPEPMERGKYINRQYRRGGTVQGYWLPAVFSHVNVEGRWYRDDPYVIADARGHSVTKAGTRGADFRRTFNDREWDRDDGDARTPTWIRDLLDEAKTEAIGWGWPLKIEPRDR